MRKRLARANAVPREPRGEGEVPATTEDSTFLIGHWRPRVPALSAAENPPKRSKSNTHCPSERNQRGTKARKAGAFPLHSAQSPRQQERAYHPSQTPWCPLHSHSPSSTAKKAILSNFKWSNFKNRQEQLMPIFKRRPDLPA